MMSKAAKRQIFDILCDIPETGLESIQKLIWTELNYPRVNQDISTRDWPEGTQDVLHQQPILLAQYKNEGETFDVIYTKLAEDQSGRGFPLSITAERTVINQLSKHHSFALFLFSDVDETYWHLVNVKHEHSQSGDNGKTGRKIQRVVRRISIGPEERLRTAAERIAMLDRAAIPTDLFGLSPLDIKTQHDIAFDVQKVTKDFFQGYKDIFNEFQHALESQTKDLHWAHDYALQFLNRLMFIYYVQRKRWLGDNPYFLENYWEAYQQTNRSEDTFVDEWLSVLFFEAFNNNFQAGRADRAYFSEALRKDLSLAPYLNGGLFEKNDLDRAYKVEITDDQFENIFNFLNQYNFTISEDTPLDQEVAVDPEMIGKVYESLVNVSEETDQQGDAGIFYTPRVEIDLMSRLSIVDWLANHLGEEHKSMLYETIFAFSPEEKRQADQALAQKNLWPRLDELLRDLKTVDPACGSGSFLIGLLYVIDDLVQRANRQLGREETPYERKKRIIGESLYGVDVMEWAVHVAELRLWLQLVIETELDPAELQFRPLLPNLSFNVRSGDSLIQEIGDIDFAIARKGSGLIPAHLKGKITRLKGEKRKFYNNDPDRKYQSKNALQQEELNIFREILDSRFQSLNRQLKEINRALRPQSDLFGDQGSGQTQKDEANFQRKKKQIEADLEQVKEARKALKDVKDLPFVWDIAFVEVFEGDRKGFDIVIGNPPYVRQEDIRDPKQPVEQVTKESKKEYKKKLRRSAYSLWPKTFGYDWAKGKNSQNTIGLRSDLYLYFYFHGLSLLNDAGSFCFVTSNSWLDVKYGKALQYFLLTRGQVKLIIDNESYRSFESADVNTTIALFAKPEDTAIKSVDSINHVARFVMLKVPFEQVLSPIIWEEVENTQERTSMPEYRVFPKKQNSLLESGIDTEKNKYEGDKWGGKYLRAPDIYHKVLKSGDIVKLSEVCDVEGYIHDNNTGKKYPKAPFIKSIKDISRIELDPDASSVRNYGVKSTGNSRTQSPILFPRTFGSRHLIVYNPGLIFGKEFYKVIPQGISAFNVTVQLNSTFGVLQREVLGAVNLGDGAIKFSGREVRMFLLLQDLELMDIEDECQHFFKRRMLDIPEELSQSDRRKIDAHIFSKLGLTQIEQDSIYESVVKLVENRMNKAKSI